MRKGKKKRFYTLNSADSPSGAASMSMPMSAAAQMDTDAKAAAQRAEARKKDDDASQTKLLEKLLVSLRDLGKQQGVYRNGAHVMLDSLVDTRITLGRIPHSTDGVAYLRVETFLKDAIFKPDASLSIPRDGFFDLCPIIHSIVAREDPKGGEAGAGAGAGAGAPNAAFFNHLLKWHEADLKPAISMSKFARAESIAKLLELSVSNGRAAAPQPDGLAVQARPFQLQTISFMADAEKHGANAGLWTQVNT